MADPLRRAFELTPERLKRYGTASARKLLDPRAADGEPLKVALELYGADIRENLNTISRQPLWGCEDRCQRIHPHCQLRLTRDIAPDSGWHWAVEMPDGHLYDVSKSPMTFPQALADMQKRGVVALDAADVIWRRMHPVPLKEPTHG